MDELCLYFGYNGILSLQCHVLAFSFHFCYVMTPLELVFFSTSFLILFLVFGFFEIIFVLKHESDCISNNTLVLTP